jgi:hypothetical protein
MSSRDDLAARARERAQGSAVPADWGSLLEIPEDDFFVGRYVTDTSDERWDPPRPAFLLVSADGDRCWIPGRYRLVQEMERVKPGRGDDIAIFRDFDIETKSGTMHVYGVEAMPNDAPLPGGEPRDIDDEPPF